MTPTETCVNCNDPAYGTLLTWWPACSSCCSTHSGPGGSGGPPACTQGRSPCLPPSPPDSPADWAGLSTGRTNTAIIQQVINGNTSVPY